MNLYAGLDEDGVVKLFARVGERKKIHIHIRHAMWLNIIEPLSLEPGEMPQVLLVKGAIPRPTLADIELRLKRLELRVDRLERMFNVRL